MRCGDVWHLEENSLSIVELFVPCVEYPVNGLM